MKFKKILFLAALIHALPSVGIQEVKSSNMSDGLKELTLSLIMTTAVIAIEVYMFKYLFEEKGKFLVFKPSDIKERFSSVAGADEAKQELEDLVDYLKNPKEYRSIGAKIRKGILLTGSPGNGKTLLARALAGEAGVPFIVINGSDFSGKYLGESTAQVSLLFNAARSLAKKCGSCIIFIDEIDVIGRMRGTGINTEQESALNKLLTEMDGFSQDGAPVIVIGATNRVNILDDALLRPGRFDRIIPVRHPDCKAREHILKIHAAKVPVDETVDLKKIAEATVGFSGAQLAAVINEAALIAKKMKSVNIRMVDIDEAIDTLRMGKKSNIKLSSTEKKITAYHEAGHALVVLLNPNFQNPLYKLTIEPRASSLGLTYTIPNHDVYSVSQKEMEMNIMMMLGGRIAEELVFNEISTGASSDYVQATQIARSMVCEFGMSEKLGPVSYIPSLDYEYSYSGATAMRIDEEVEKIIMRCYAETKKLLKNNRDMLDKLAKALLEKETMYASEVYELLGITPRESYRLV